MTSAFLSLRAHSPCSCLCQFGAGTDRFDFADQNDRQAARDSSTHGGNIFAKGSYRGKDSDITSAVGHRAAEPEGISAVPAGGGAAVDADVGEPSDKQSSGRSRQFRQRKLSKDYIPDDSDAELASRDAMLRGSPLSSHASSSAMQSPYFSRARSVIDSPAAARAASLQQLVRVEAEEAQFGNPNSLGVMEEVVAAATISPSNSRRASRDSHSSTTVTPAGQRRTKPSQQPKTAEKTPALSESGSLTIGGEMGEDEENRMCIFDETMVGSYSCHGLEPGRDGNGSVAKINQDCACMGHPFAGLKGTAIFCVYDGHGKQGHEVNHIGCRGNFIPAVCPFRISPMNALPLFLVHSQVSHEAMHTIFHMLEECADELYDEPEATLADAFEACNIHLRLMACEPEIEVNSLESGTCALVAYLHHRQLRIASVGDCRCVLGSRPDNEGEVEALQLSTDHKVSLPLEKERIESTGGWVRMSRIDPENGEVIPARMYEVEGKPWLGPGLCVSRALGDLNALRCGLIPTPEIYKHTICPEDRFLILASDGVWEFIENEEAVQIVDQFHRKGLPALNACRHLIAKAAVCWRKFEGDYRDDITAIVVYLDEVLNVLADEDPDVSTEAAPVTAT